MYLLKKFVSLGRGSTVENGEEDSVDEESTSSSLSSRSQQSREESECNNNNKSESVTAKKKRKRSKKKLKEKDEDESSSSISVSKNDIPEQFYDDLSETTESETKTTSEETSLGSSNGRKAISSGDAEFWTAAISETGRETDSISKNENWNDDKKEESDIEDVWADRENDEIPKKRISFDEGEVKRDERKEKEENTDSLSDVWGDRDEDDIPRKKSLSSELVEEKVDDVWAGRNEDDVLGKKKKEPSPGDIWGNDTDDDMPQKSDKESFPADVWGDRSEDDMPRKPDKEKSPGDISGDRSEDDAPRKPDKETSPGDVWGDRSEDDMPRKPDKEPSPRNVWVDRNHDELPRESIPVTEIPNHDKDSSPDTWGDQNSDAPKRSSPEIEKLDICADEESSAAIPTDERDGTSNSNEESTPSDVWDGTKNSAQNNDQLSRNSKESTPIPATILRKSESPPSDIWGDKEDDAPPPPKSLKEINTDYVSCRKSEEFENFSETESSSKKDSTTESDKKQSSSPSSTSTDDEDEDDDKSKTGSSELPAPSIPPPPPPPPPDFFDEKPTIRPVNDPEYRRAHRRSFINVIKDVETPSRRRSVVLQESRERAAWRESKKESISSVDNGDDGSDLDDLPDDSFMNYLGKENDKAEARLLARRQARVEAREIRLRELEKQQKEQEENADKVFDMSYGTDSIVRTGRVAPTVLTPRERPMSITNSYHSSRRSSEDSIEDGYSLRDLRHEVKEIEEKFRKAMIANAQLDNEKSALSYQVELLKDKLEDMEESHAQLSREHRDKCREHEQLKRAAVKLKEDLAYCKYQLDERDRLIAEYGLVIVGEDGEDGESTKRTLVSVQSAELLQKAGSGSLDVRLKKFAEERNELLDEIRHLKLELEEEKSKRASDGRSGHGSLSNGPLDEETSKLISDYKFKLQKAEQDVSTLQANVARLESQVIRYKSAAETSEKAEDELKIEKRKLQRENRESIARIEELETANSHLQRRMDKLKNAKSTLLKEL